MAQIKKANMFNVVKNHMKRTVNIVWNKVLEDPRSEINRTLDFGYAMKSLFFGILSGMKNLREIETFSEVSGERIPDTTMHNLIIEIDPEPLRKELVSEVKTALRNHELPSDEFPLRVTAIDGKCISVSARSVGEFSQESACNGTVHYVNRALRAFHVSNETTLCLGQREIHGKAAETSEFQPFMRSLIEDYGKTSLLEVISVDAGMTSKANADFLKDKDLHYIMGLKGPQQTLFANAKTLLESRGKPNKVTTDQANGTCVVREFFRCTVLQEYQHGWGHLQEFWRIRQTSTNKANGEVEIEDRYFLSSISPQKLNDAQVMQVIRMHWRIENNGNWITDTAFQEDNSPFANYALVLISLMRMLAFNIISRLKTRRMRQAQARAMSWSAVMKLIEHAVIELIKRFDVQEDSQPAFL